MDGDMHTALSNNARMRSDTSSDNCFYSTHMHIHRMHLTDGEAVDGSSEGSVIWRSSIINLQGLCRRMTETDELKSVGTRAFIPESDPGAFRVERCQVEGQLKPRIAPN